MELSCIPVICIPMRKTLTLALAALCLFSNAQELGVWNDLYSYNRVTDIVQMNGSYLCAAGMATYKFDYVNREIDKFSKANGLNDTRVTALERDPSSGIVVIGYENANIDILDGDRVFNMSDIVNSEKFSGRKRINDIEIHGEYAYLLTGFGVVQLDFKRRLIIDTWIIGPNATEMEVFDLAIDEAKDTIWLSTEDGFYKAYAQDALYYFTSWTKDAKFNPTPGEFIEYFDGSLFAVGNFTQQDTLYIRSSNGSWTSIPDNPLGVIRQVEVEDGRFMVTSAFASEERDASGQRLTLITGGYGGNAGFDPLYSVRDDDGNWFIGDANQGLIFIDNPNYVQRAKPLSPRTNLVYSLYIGTEGLYVSTGNVNGVWAPTYNFEGFYNLFNQSWSHFDVSVTDTSHDVLQVLEDPLDPTRLFVAAMGSGILEYRNGVLYQKWDEASTNQVLRGTGSNPLDLRTGGMDFDADGVLWVSCSNSQTSLASYDRDGNWEAHSIGTFNGSEIKNIRVLENGDFWIQGRNDGIYSVRMRDGTTSTQHLSTGEGNGDLSSSFVHDFEEDLDGEVWIGTGEGVMVQYAPDNMYISGRNYDARSIIVLEDGVYQRLLGSEGILAVEIDGANRKWFGTETGGVFLISEDGQDEIHHFTKENSPLPSNRVSDVKVDPNDGTVYIATDLGVVTFNGDATAGSETMEEVTVYPNPVRPGYTGPIAIRGLVEDAQVKITDVAGNIVFETRANGGQAVWYGEDLSGNRVATGVYLAYITDDLGENTHVTKILLVNGN